MGRTVQRWKSLFNGARWRLLVALLGIAILCVAGTPKPTPLDDRAAWREACHLAGYSCAWIPRPFVTNAPLIDILGRYRMGDKYILLNENISGSLAYAVQVHEMTHYLQWKHGRWKFTPESRCENERDAFEVSNVVLRRLKATTYLVEWDKAKNFYGCP